MEGLMSVALAESQQAPRAAPAKPEWQYKAVMDMDAVLDKLQRNRAELNRKFIEHENAVRAFREVTREFCVDVFALLNEQK
jgi:hypothetical protein